MVSSWLRLSQDARFAKTVANSSGSLPPRYGGIRMSGRPALRNSPFDAGAGSASFAQCPALSRDSRSGVVLRRAPKLHRAVGGGISYAASISARVSMESMALCPLRGAASVFDSRVQRTVVVAPSLPQYSLRGRENIQLHVAGARLCQRRPWTWERAPLTERRAPRTHGQLRREVRRVGKKSANEQDKIR